MNRATVYILSAALVVALAGAGSWGVVQLVARPEVTVAPRVPYIIVVDTKPPVNTTTQVARNLGTLIPGPGKPSDEPGDWPWFRGADRANIAPASEKVARTWPESGPQVLWRLPLGEGHAGPAVHKGRVFIVDYDREKQEDAIRCVSLADGAEIWRYTYYVQIKRNHGMSRTVPAVTDDYVVAMGPMGQVTCLRMATGELVWKMDLVKDYGTTVPPWYAGQCPYIDGSQVILAPGGKALLMAVDLATGNVAWQTPNPDGWGMTHASIAAVTVAGRKQYVYPATYGVVGVDAEDGKLLWKIPDWTVKLANIPSPVPAGDGRFLLTGGYGSGAMMVRVAGNPPAPETVYRLKPEVFGSEQHTPILYNGRFYGVIQGGFLTCMDVEGRQVWNSGSSNRFGLGPFFIADGVIFVLHDMNCTLHMIEASPSGYKELARAKVLNGHDAWAPMALVNGKLLVRDMTEMVCLKVGTREP